MGEDETVQFIAAQQNENTKRKTVSDMRLFKAFCVSRGKNRPIESLQPLELDSLFGNVLITIKKQKGMSMNHRQSVGSFQVWTVTSKRTDIRTRL